MTEVHQTHSKASQPDHMSTATPPHEAPIVPRRMVVKRVALDDALGLVPGSEEISVAELIRCHGFEASDAPLLEEALGDNAIVWLPGDTRETIELVRTQGLDAQPLFQVWSFNHWSFFPPGETIETPSLGARGRFAAQIAALQPSGGQDRPVFVIDTGCYSNHPYKTELGNRFRREAPADEDGWHASHGTLVGCVVAMVSPGSEVRHVRVELTDTHRPHDPTADEVAIAKALQRVSNIIAGEELQAPVVNMSFGTYAAELAALGGGGSTLGSGHIVSDKIDAFVHRHPDATLVAAGGNDFADDAGTGFTLAFPASHPQVTSVGAGDGGDDEDWYLWVDDPSGRHPTNATPGLWSDHFDHAAPGVNVVGVAGLDVGVGGGSSMAAAVVSGLIARGSAPAGYIKTVPNLVIGP